MQKNVFFRRPTFSIDEKDRDFINNRWTNAENIILKLTTSITTNSKRKSLHTNRNELRKPLLNLDKTRKTSKRCNLSS
ncbi:MAG: hypothetical protein OXK80_04375 [Bdellovibrionales bacterium]|nr:hypothetical protein [Bdellovibrionales bacterium]